MQSRYSETGKCLITWHDDGTLCKELVSSAALDPAVSERFAYERQINKLFVANPPPVPFAALVGVEHAGDSLRFQAIEGEPYGPKFPSALAKESLLSLLKLAIQLQAYNPTESWIRRYDPAQELRLRLKEGVIGSEEFDLADRLIKSQDWGFSFAHGDLTPRNVLASPRGAVLIDWEFAGWYPNEYDRAFLWMVLADLPDARSSVVESLSNARRASFWLCAYLILLMHLGMWARRQNTHPFLARHLDTKQYALSELQAASASNPP